MWHSTGTSYCGSGGPRGNKFKYEKHVRSSCWLPMRKVVVLARSLCSDLLFHLRSGSEKKKHACQQGPLSSISKVGRECFVVAGTRNQWPWHFLGKGVGEMCFYRRRSLPNRISRSNLPLSESDKFRLLLIFAVSGSSYPGDLGPWWAQVGVGRGVRRAGGRAGRFQVKGSRLGFTLKRTRRDGSRFPATGSRFSR